MILIHFDLRVVAHEGESPENTKKRVLDILSKGAFAYADRGGEARFLDFSMEPVGTSNLADFLKMPAYKMVDVHVIQAIPVEKNHANRDQAEPELEGRPDPDLQT